MSSSASPGHPALTWLQAIREPEIAVRWQLSEWERVVRLSRRLRLLARLAASIEAAGLLERLPAAVQRNLLAELRLSHWRTASMTWLLDRVAATLAEQACPLVLLKGAAYIGQDLPISVGRLPSDVDILVPRNHLSQVQARLVQAGWHELELDEHDHRYYHQWSHEVPPMRHPIHRVELDLHHNILPPVARAHVDADALLGCLRPSKWAPWQVLDPVDQVLHSAAHLFLDSEMRDRIRDLVDLDGLLRHFATEPGFMSRLPERAQALGLEEPLALASHFCLNWFGTPIPADVVESIESIGPGRFRRAWLLPLLSTALMPSEPDDHPPPRQGLAAVVLLARYHRQRMPLRLLVPHLWHKLSAGRGARSGEAAGAAQA